MTSPAEIIRQPSTSRSCPHTLALVLRVVVQSIH